ncbi:MAG TPA: type II toxin-antitoxin system Phd/YefM family antitoxin [Thermoanaerobaculia bacterium]|jgi:prevent-host-death family protein
MATVVPVVKVHLDRVNVAEAKKRLSDLLGRVAYRKETILITRRGRPMARLVPPDDEAVEQGLAAVRGWLPENDPFFSAVDEVVDERLKHRPRVVGARRRNRQ